MKGANKGRGGPPMGRARFWERKAFTLVRRAAMQPWAGWNPAILMAVGAVVLGYIGFCKVHPDAHWLDILYLDLQLFVLESGYIQAGTPWELQVARLLAPGVPVFTAGKAVFAIFRGKLRILYSRYRAGHVVVCGLGRKGMRLVEDFVLLGLPVVALELEQNRDEIRQAEERGAVVVRGDATDKELLRRTGVHRARYLFATCGDDSSNVEIAIRAYELVREMKTPVDKMVRCLAHLVDLRLCAFFRRHKIVTDTSDSIDVSVFNAYENSVRILLRDMPLDRAAIRCADDAQIVHLIIVGFGLMGQSLAVQAAKVAHFANGRAMRLSVIDLQAIKLKRIFLGQYRFFERTCDIAFLEQDVFELEALTQIVSWCSDEVALTTVAVCFDDDSSALSCALRILPRVSHLDVPVCIRMSGNTGLASLLDADHSEVAWARHAHPFGMISQSCSADLLLGEQLDQLAKAIHGDFVEEAVSKGRRPDVATEPSLLPWNQLPAEYRESNRQAADHIEVKLRAIGCRAMTQGDGEPIAVFTNDEILMLARMEHARWCAERYLAGWSHGPGPKNSERKTNPTLTSWEGLDEQTREYNYQAICSIPRLLGLVGLGVYRGTG